MTVRVIFRDLTETWEEELSSPAPLTCAQAALAALERRGKSPKRSLAGVIFMADGKRLEPETPLCDGDSITAVVLVGGG